MTKESLNKRIYLVVLVFLLVFGIPFCAYGSSEYYFADVPENHWASEHIYKLKELGIVTGSVNENNQLIFGLGNRVTKAEFLTMLTRLFNNGELKPQEVTFIDIREGDWFYKSVVEGIGKGIILQNQEEYPNMEFKPNQFITRLEMAKMIVRAMGYDNLGKVLWNTDEFNDVDEGVGYVKICKDLGIMKGKFDESGSLVFAPREEATREEAVTIISRLRDILNNKLKTSHVFYAISSYSQINKIQEFNSIGFGWSGLYFDKNLKKVVISTRKDEQDYYLPEGYQEPIQTAKENNLKTYLMVYGSNSKIRVDDLEIGLIEYLLDNKENQREITETLINNPFNLEEELSFNGIIIDFEGLKDRNNVKEEYIEFLRNLKNGLNSNNLELIVCLHPIREGRSYFDGYDYYKIGELADKVILMAHDYNPSNINDLHIEYSQAQFPLAPMADVYEAITKTIEKGIPREKVLLQISFNKESWTLEENGNKRVWKNDYISYSEISKLLESDNIILNGYDENYEAPYIFVVDNEGNFKRVIWYEDSRSIRAKIKLAKDFGLGGISVWRLGLIGDISHDENGKYFLDTWSEIKGIYGE